MPRGKRAPLPEPPPPPKLHPLASEWGATPKFHQVGKCRWCRGRFVFVFGEQWICETPNCAERQIANALTKAIVLPNESPYLFLPLPLQVEIEELTAKRLLVWGPVGISKALALDTPIPTPRGWIEIQHIQAGDTVFDEHGAKCRVIETTPHHYDETGTYRLAFDDGTTAITGGAHEWLTWSLTERDRKDDQQRARRRARRGGKARTGRKWTELQERAHQPIARTGSVRTTLEIFQTQRVRTKRQANHAIRLAGAWDLPIKPLPLDPYVLGAWLGDGTGVTGVITTADAEMVANIESRGFTCRRIPSAKYAWRIDGLTRRLTQLGQIGNKHVPSDYLTASIEQREDLLKGLMDTDGHCRKNGLTTFTNMNIRLADAVYDLAISLGLKAFRSTAIAKIGTKQCGIAHTVYWTSTRSMFSLTRKTARIPMAMRKTQLYRYIVSVDRIPDRPLKCLTVDSQSRLFLATKAAIPTHNSFGLRRHLYARCRKIPGYRALLLRATYDQLYKNHLQFMHQEAAELGDATFKMPGGGKPAMMTFENGSAIFMGYLDDESDIAQHMGPEWDEVDVDEANHIIEKGLQKVTSRDRGSKSSYKTRMALGIEDGRSRLLSNIGGRAWPYLETFYIDKNPDPQEYPFYDPADYSAITGDLDDNPYLASTMRSSVLGGLDADTYAQLADGRRDVFPGQFFRHFDRKVHVIGDPS